MKYVKIVVKGEKPLYADENSEKQKPADPDFKSQDGGIVVWINERRA